MIDPHRVARVILEAAPNGGRDITVGAMARLLPSLADKMAAMQPDRQRRDLLAQAPEGALFRPRGGGRIYDRTRIEIRTRCQPAASWKMTPNVYLLPLRNRLTPWRMFTRYGPRTP